MMRILFVDDDLNMHKMVELFLKNHEMEVTCAKNGRSALTLFSKNIYDIVISDIQMPEMNGLTLLKEIRNINNEIPFVVVSAFGQEKMSKTALTNGANIVINKPFESKKLLNVIKELV